MDGIPYAVASYGSTGGNTAVLSTGWHWFITLAAPHATGLLRRLRDAPASLFGATVVLALQREG